MEHINDFYVKESKRVFATIKIVIIKKQGCFQTYVNR